jgi:hypothetical protein
LHINAGNRRCIGDIKKINRFEKAKRMSVEAVLKPSVGFNIEAKQLLRKNYETANIQKH